jgi:hypothetical protein
MLKLILVLLLSALMFSCEFESNESEAEAEGTETSQSAEGTAGGEAPASNSVPDGAWDNINWFTSRGPAGRDGAPQVMTLSASITSDARFVNFAWDRIPWGGSFLAHFFVWNEGAGRWEGGKFEWIRAGGQSQKLLQNIANGYNGLSTPPSGARVAFAWTNEQGTERSNLVETRWP